MRVVTLVTEALAEKGTKFRVRVNAKCLTCSLRKVCIGRVRQGFEYRVVEVRSKRHKCPLTGSDMVVVVVEPEPLKVFLNTPSISEGLITSFNPPRCAETRCPYREFCIDSPLKDGEKIRVMRVVRRVTCPQGLRLFLVEALPLSFLRPSRT